MLKYHDFNLTHYNGYKISSNCRIAFFPENEEEIIHLVRRYPNAKLIGSGHNIILSKKYYDEVFIILNSCLNDIILIEPNLLYAQAGALMKDVSEFAQKEGLSGLEFFYDIPSSLGGAVVMNAGTKEGETSEVVKKVRYLDLVEMKIREVNVEQMNFRYRNSMFQNCTDKVILSAWFELHPDDKETILDRMQMSKERRWSKQPRQFPNCGSVFKRPPGKYVGPMIEELGLKGYRIGDAEISEKHGGFIINRGNATGDDIIKLIDHVINKVKDKFDVDLEIEQRVI